MQWYNIDSKIQGDDSKGLLFLSFYQTHLNPRFQWVWSTWEPPWSFLHSPHTVSLKGWPLVNCLFQNTWHCRQNIDIPLRPVFLLSLSTLKKGLEETESGVWKLLMAVAVHSSAVAFCIGAELVAKGGGLEIITHGKYWLFPLLYQTQSFQVLL